MEIVKKLIWIAILIALIAAVVVGSLYVRYLVISKNFGDYWTQKRLDEGQIVYVALGDSTAVGVGASSPKNSYIGIIAQNIQTTTEKSVKIVNLAQPGKHIKDVIENQVPQLSQYHPDLVTISVGANDINSNEDIATINQNIDALIEVLPSGSYFAEIPSFIDPQKNSKIMKINQHLNEVAGGTGVHVVPMYQATEKVKNDFSYLDFDFFHPNDRGYKLWADTFLNEIK